MIPEKSFDDITDDPNVQMVSKDRESLASSDKLELVLENIADDPNSMNVIKAVPIEEDDPENSLDSNYRTIVYDTEDITLKEETLDCIPDDLHASRVGNVNETVTIPEKSFDNITDDPNVQNSNDRGSLARTGKILENTPENPTPKKVVVIPLLRSKKQVSAKKERSKKILKVS